MKKGQEEHWNQEGYKHARQLHDSAYFSGFHRGRHKEREELVNSGWLIIDPNKKKELENALEDPCKYCENYTKEYKIGCNSDPKTCERKQKQFLALEIKSYFGMGINK